RLLCEVGVPLRRPRMQMPKKALYDVERHASIDKEARKRVAQVVQANIRENCALANTIPGKIQRCRRPTVNFGWENVWIAVNARSRRQKSNCRSVERDDARPP